MEMRIPCQRNESERAGGKAEDDGMGDPASTIANAIRPVPFVTREATLALIHCGRLMVKVSLPAFVATHI